MYLLAKDIVLYKRPKSYTRKLLGLRNTLTKLQDIKLTSKPMGADDAECK